MINYKLRIYIILITTLFMACEDNAPKNNDSVLVSEENKKDPIPETKEDGTKAIDIELSKDEKTVVAVLDKALDLGKEAIQRKRMRDSLRMANREQMFVYQIGLPARHEDDIIKEYQKLINTEDVFIFKNGKRDYFLVKDEGLSEQALKDSFEIFKQQLPSTIIGSAKVINIMQLCSRKEKLTRAKNIYLRKSKLEIPCFICD